MHHDDIDREDILQSRDLVAELEARGVTLIGSGNQRMAKCPFHDEKNPSFSVNVIAGLWKCHTGCGQGSVIDLIALFESRHPKDVYRDLAKDLNPNSSYSPPPFQPPPNTGDLKFVCAYHYTDAEGREVFQVHRMKRPDGTKTFLQGHKGNLGEWIPNMNGVTRVPYRLHEFSTEKEVWLTEGEKDADTLCDLGFRATTNPGGADAWLDSYAEFFVGKDVIFCGDNDGGVNPNTGKLTKGQKHLASVKKSLEGKVRSLRVLQLPEGYADKRVKDVTDLYEAAGRDVCGGILMRLKDEARVLPKGFLVAGDTLTELRVPLLKQIEETHESPVNLGALFPSLSRYCRPLIPGDLVTVIASTAAGKTALVQNLMYALSDIPTCFFQMEISGELLLERFLGIDYGIEGRDVQDELRKGNLPPTAKEEECSRNQLIFTETRLTVDKVEEHCRRSELKLGRPPRLIVVDYLQLMGGKGDGRYERFSDIAEGLRQMAKRLNASVILTCQSKRKESGDDEVYLTDGKESGSIENSSSLVLGIWREELVKNSGRYDKMIVRILKNTRGSAGHDIECKWHTNLRITEIPPILE